MSFNKPFVGDNDRYERSKIGRLRDEREEIQAKTYKNWINSILIQDRTKIDDIYTDLTSGEKLITLLELLTNEKFAQINNSSNGPDLLHKIANVSQCLNFIKNKNVYLESIGPDDIVNGNKKLTLGLIWTLILRFQLSKSSEFHQYDLKTIKESLLLWCSNKIKKLSFVKIVDFHQSWKNGWAFVALVYSFRPESIQIEPLKRKEDRERLEIAFDTAYQHLLIPKILDTDDVINSPDENSILTYVSYFFNLHSKSKSSETNVKRIRCLLSNLGDMETMKQEYVVLCQSLLDWIFEKITLFEQEVDIKRAQEELFAFNNYFFNERPEKLKMRNDCENIYFELDSIQKNSGVKTFVPMNGQSVKDLEKAWLNLEKVELKRKSTLNDLIIKHGKLSRKEQLFHLKCTKFENYIVNKMDLLNELKNVQNISKEQLENHLRQSESICRDIIFNNMKFDYLINLADELIAEECDNSQIYSQYKEYFTEKLTKLHRLSSDYLTTIHLTKQLFRDLSSVENVSNELKDLNTQLSLMTSYIDRVESVQNIVLELDRLKYLKLYLNILEDKYTELEKNFHLFSANETYKSCFIYFDISIYDSMLKNSNESIINCNGLIENYNELLNYKLMLNEFFANIDCIRQFLNEKRLVTNSNPNEVIKQSNVNSVQRQNNITKLEMKVMEKELYSICKKGYNLMDQKNSERSAFIIETIETTKNEFQRFIVTVNERTLLINDCIALFLLINELNNQQELINNFDFDDNIATIIDEDLIDKIDRYQDDLLYLNDLFDKFSKLSIRMKEFHLNVFDDMNDMPKTYIIYLNNYQLDQIDLSCSHLYLIIEIDHISNFKLEKLISIHRNLFDFIKLKLDYIKQIAKLTKYDFDTNKLKQMLDVNINEEKKDNINIKKLFKGKSKHKATIEEIDLIMKLFFEKQHQNEFADMLKDRHSLVVSDFDNIQQLISMIKYTMKLIESVKDILDFSNSHRQQESKKLIDNLQTLKSHKDANKAKQMADLNRPSSTSNEPMSKIRKIENALNEQQREPSTTGDVEGKEIIKISDFSSDSNFYDTEKISAIKRKKIFYYKLKNDIVFIDQYFVDVNSNYLKYKLNFLGKIVKDNVKRIEIYIVEGADDESNEDIKILSNELAKCNNQITNCRKLSDFKELLDDFYYDLVDNLYNLQCIQPNFFEFKIDIIREDLKTIDSIEILYYYYYDCLEEFKKDDYEYDPTINQYIIELMLIFDRYQKTIKLTKEFLAKKLSQLENSQKQERLNSLMKKYGIEQSTTLPITQEINIVKNISDTKSSSDDTGKLFDFGKKKDISTGQNNELDKENDIANIMITIELILFDIHCGNPYNYPQEQVNELYKKALSLTNDPEIIAKLEDFKKQQNIILLRQTREHKFKEFQTESEHFLNCCKQNNDTIDRLLNEVEEVPLEGSHKELLIDEIPNLKSSYIRNKMLFELLRKEYSDVDDCEIRSKIVHLQDELMKLKSRIEDVQSLLDLDEQMKPILENIEYIFIITEQDDIEYDDLINLTAIIDETKNLTAEIKSSPNIYLYLALNELERSDITVNKLSIIVRYKILKYEFDKKLKNFQQRKATDNEQFQIFLISIEQQKEIIENTFLEGDLDDATNQKMLNDILDNLSTLMDRLDSFSYLLESDYFRREIQPETDNQTEYYIVYADVPHESNISSTPITTHELIEQREYSPNKLNIPEIIKHTQDTTNVPIEIKEIDPEHIEIIVDLSNSKKKIRKIKKLKYPNDSFNENDDIIQSDDDSIVEADSADDTVYKDFIVEYVDDKPPEEEKAKKKSKIIKKITRISPDQSKRGKDLDDEFHSRVLDDISEDSELSDKDESDPNNESLSVTKKSKKKMIKKIIRKISPTKSNEESIIDSEQEFDDNIDGEDDDNEEESIDQIDIIYYDMGRPKKSNIKKLKKISAKSQTGLEQHENVDEIIEETENPEEESPKKVNLKKSKKKIKKLKNIKSPIMNESIDNENKFEDSKMITEEIPKEVIVDLPKINNQFVKFNLSNNESIIEDNPIDEISNILEKSSKKPNDKTIQKDQFESITNLPKEEMDKQLFENITSKNDEDQFKNDDLENKKPISKKAKKKAKKENKKMKDNLKNSDADKSKPNLRDEPKSTDNKLSVKNETDEKVLTKSNPKETNKLDLDDKNVPDNWMDLDDDNDDGSDLKQKTDDVDSETNKSLNSSIINDPCSTVKSEHAEPIKNINYDTDDVWLDYFSLNPQTNTKSNFSATIIDLEQTANDTELLDDEKINDKLPLDNKSKSPILVETSEKINSKKSKKKNKKSKGKHPEPVDEIIPNKETCNNPDPDSNKTTTKNDKKLDQSKSKPDKSAKSKKPKDKLDSKEDTPDDWMDYLSSDDELKKKSDDALTNQLSLELQPDMNNLKTITVNANDYSKLPNEIKLEKEESSINNSNDYLKNNEENNLEENVPVSSIIDQEIKPDSIMDNENMSINFGEPTKSAAIMPVTKIEPDNKIELDKLIPVSVDKSEFSCEEPEKINFNKEQDLPDNLKLDNSINQVEDKNLTNEFKVHRHPKSNNQQLIIPFEEYEPLSDSDSYHEDDDEDTKQDLALINLEQRVDDIKDQLEEIIFKLKPKKNLEEKIIENDNDNLVSNETSIDKIDEPENEEKQDEEEMIKILVDHKKPNKNKLKKIKKYNIPTRKLNIEHKDSDIIDSLDNNEKDPKLESEEIISETIIINQEDNKENDFSKLNTLSESIINDPCSKEQDTVDTVDKMKQNPTISMNSSSVWMDYFTPTEHEPSKEENYDTSSDFSNAMIELAPCTPRPKSPVFDDKNVQLNKSNEEIHSDELKDRKYKKAKRRLLKMPKLNIQIENLKRKLPNNEIKQENMKTSPTHFLVDVDSIKFDFVTSNTEVDSSEQQSPLLNDQNFQFNAKQPKYKKAKRFLSKISNLVPNNILNSKNKLSTIEPLETENLEKNESSKSDSSRPAIIGVKLKNNSILFDSDKMAVEEISNKLPDNSREKGIETSPPLPASTIELKPSKNAEILPKLSTNNDNNKQINEKPIEIKNELDSLKLLKNTSDLGNISLNDHLSDTSQNNVTKASIEPNNIDLTFKEQGQPSVEDSLKIIPDNTNYELEPKSDFLQQTPTNVCEEENTKTSPTHSFVGDDPIKFDFATSPIKVDSSEQQLPLLNDQNVPFDAELNQPNKGRKYRKAKRFLSKNSNLVPSNNTNYELESKSDSLQQTPTNVSWDEKSLPKDNQTKLVDKKNEKMKQENETSTEQQSFKLKNPIEQLLDVNPVKLSENEVKNNEIKVSFEKNIDKDLSKIKANIALEKTNDPLSSEKTNNNNNNKKVSKKSKKIQFKNEVEIFSDKQTENNKDNQSELSTSSGKIQSTLAKNQLPPITTDVQSSKTTDVSVLKNVCQSISQESPELDSISSLKNKDKFISELPVKQGIDYSVDQTGPNVHEPVQHGHPDSSIIYPSDGIEKLPPTLFVNDCKEKNICIPNISLAKDLAKSSKTERNEKQNNSSENNANKNDRTKSKSDFEYSSYYTITPEISQENLPTLNSKNDFPVDEQLTNKSFPAKNNISNEKKSKKKKNKNISIAEQETDKSENGKITLNNKITMMPDDEQNNKKSNVLYDKNKNFIYQENDPKKLSKKELIKISKSNSKTSGPIAAITGTTAAGLIEMVDANHQHNKKSDIIKSETIASESNDSTSGNHLDQSIDDSLNAVQSNIDDANLETIPKDSSNIKYKKYLIYDKDQSNGFIDANQTEPVVNANSENINGDGLMKLTVGNLIQPNLVDDEKNHLNNYFDKKFGLKPKYRKARHHQRSPKRHENELMIQSKPGKDKGLIISEPDTELNRMESAGTLSFTQRLFRYSIPFYFLFFLLFLIFLLIPLGEDDLNCLRSRTQYAYSLKKLFIYGPPPI